MCGIAGFQGRFDLALIQRMTDTLAHRGPDGQGTFVHDGADSIRTALGHRRLSIIDLSDAGAQPMHPLPDTGGGRRSELTLVYNGEIYNFQTLRDELVLQGHEFASRTDSEVLLHLYEQHGFSMLDRLNGIFAFAIHDDRPDGRPDGMPRGGLFLARDQLGVKPLYVACIDDGFLFGSEIKALLEEPRLPRDIDHIALHNTLAYLWSPAPRTMLRAVRKLEPGCALVVHGGRVVIDWRYFTLPYDGSTFLNSEPELVAELQQRLRTAVARQLVADVPVGAFLSGGLDSSAIVAMMRATLPSAEIAAFTIAFRDEPDTEGNPSDLPYARKVARHVGVDLHEVLIDANVIGRLPELVSLLDEPQADPAPINALIIAEHARAIGIPVLLSGAGGDDLFSGYRRHWALQFESRWSWLPESARIGLQRVATGIGGQRNPILRRFSKMFAHAGDSPERRLASYFLWSTEAVRSALYTDDFAETVAGADTLAPLLSSLAEIGDEHDPLQRMLFLETRHFLADHNLNYTDRAGMAVGVEIRVPLLDLDLVRFAAKVPSRFKQQGRVSKAILKRAMEQYLPKEVVYRPKSGFGAPLRRWLTRELRPMLEDTLSAAVLARRGIFRPDAVRRLIELNADGRIDASYTLFAIMCIELWLRRFVDEDPAHTAPTLNLSPQVHSA